MKKEKESSLLSEKQKNKIIDAYHLQLQIHEAGILNEQIYNEIVYVCDTYFTKKPEGTAITQMVRHTRDKLFFLTLKEIPLAYEFAFQDLFNIILPTKLNLLTNYRILRAYSTLSYPIRDTHRAGTKEKEVVKDLVKGKYYFLQMNFVARYLQMKPKIIYVLQIWDYMVQEGNIVDIRESQMKFRNIENGDAQFNCAKKDILCWLQVKYPHLYSNPDIVECQYSSLKIVELSRLPEYQKKPSNDSGSK